MKQTSFSWRQIQPLLYPQFPWQAWPGLLLLTLIGALIAGGYGIIHDQITFTLSSEYFTKFKFGQFHYADLRRGDRVFAGTIGFLATWWVGGIAGWVLGRLSLKPGARGPEYRLVMRSFLLMFGVSLLFGGLGYVYGTITFEQAPQKWHQWRTIYLIEDLSAFARVGYIHNMSYIGGAVGSVLAGIWLRRKLVAR